jgi:Fe-S-cluster containining protein
MPQRDSIDKIVEAYFAVVTARDFEYKGKLYRARPYVVSPGIFRGYTCPPSCGACCPRFSLDYLPTEARPARLKAEDRFVQFNGNHVRIVSDTQEDHDSHHCRFLRVSDGRCTIHKANPFSCDFELIRSAIMQDTTMPNRLTTRLFGRGWQMLRVDNERGARCEIVNVTEASIEDAIRKLARLLQWANYFGVRTHLKRVIAWAQTATPTNIPKPLRVEPDHVR